MSKAEQWINDRRILWERRLDRLGDYLDRTEGQDGLESPKGR
jgi:hypothetical protein